jgi:NADH:ubiquinone oxidoreductase subunit 3 (subunit A)
MDSTIEMIIFSPIIIFLFSLTLGYLIYALGNKIAPKLKEKDDKLKTYACGEELPLKSHKPSYHFFYLALLFTVFHVGAIYLTTAVVGMSSALVIIYISFMLISIIVLMKR